MSNLSFIDILVIAAYFILLAAIAWWAAKREKNISSDFFLASRDVGWLAVGASLFASNIGSEHLVGLAGTGAASGLAVGHFEWLASFILLLLGWLFVPFYLRSGVYTMPEFLERRYNSGSRAYFTWVSIIGYVLTKISVTLFAGGIVMRAVTGFDFWTSAAILIVITGLYTIFGGLRAVIYTEVLQAVVLILGSVTLMFIGLHAVGGWSGLKAAVPPDFFSMWKPMHHKDFPWTGVVFGAPILGIWYWCTDQHIVQRVLAARNIQEARRGTIFAGYLKILPVFIFVLPGIVAAALYADVRGGQADSAYPILVTRLLPIGFKGLVLAGMLAALMSSLASAFNSCSTLLTWDVYRKWRPNATEARLVFVGRVTTVILVFAGLVWIPFMKYVSPQIYIYLQSVQRTADCRLLPARRAQPALEREGSAGSIVDRIRPRLRATGARARQGQSDARRRFALVRGYQLPALRSAAVRAVQPDPDRRQHHDAAADAGARCRSHPADRCPIGRG
jgi:SSS family solute:Na+ symporter